MINLIEKILPNLRTLILSDGNPDYLYVSLDNVRVVKEASPESNVATSTYDVSHQLNDRLYASVTVSTASLYEVLARSDADDGGAELLREILRYSQGPMGVCLGNPV